MRLQKALTFSVTHPVGGVVRRSTSGGLRFEADDVDRAHGSGPAVRGDADAPLLAITGRAIALDHLSGDGLPTLRGRLT